MLFPVASSFWHNGAIVMDCRKILISDGKPFFDRQMGAGEESPHPKDKLFQLAQI